MRQLTSLAVALALIGGFAHAQDPPRLGIYFDPSGDGIIVEEVMPDSPAARAGLKAGDRIARFGDRRISSDADLLGALREVKAGQTVTLEIVRDGEKIERPVSFGAEKSGQATEHKAAIPAIPLVPPAPKPSSTPAAAGELGKLDGVIARALESLEGEPGVGEIARARVLLRKARQQLKEIAEAHPAAPAAGHAAPAPPTEPEADPAIPPMPVEGMDFTKLTERIEELMSSGKSPEEIQKIIADEFPGIQVVISTEEMTEEVPEPPTPEPAEPTKPTKKKGAGK
jgi:membrane-associated protease RseP (regulator of RpoE activity)